MKKILGPILGALIVLSAPAGAATQGAVAAKATALDPAALALAHQILDIGIPAEKRSQMFGSVMDTLMGDLQGDRKSALSTKDKDFQALMDRSTQRMWDQIKPIMNAALPDIFESMARAYAREFSTDDLTAILAFVKTPAGQHFRTRSEHPESIPTQGCERSECWRSWPTSCRKSPARIGRTSRIMSPGRRSRRRPPSRNPSPEPLAAPGFAIFASEAKGGKPKLPALTITFRSRRSRSSAAGWRCGRRCGTGSRAPARCRRPICRRRPR